MSDIYDLIDPVELTEVARLALADEDRPENAFRLGQWFPGTLTSQIEFKASRGTTRTYTTAAPFRAFTTPPRLGTRPGRTEVRGELAPISLEFLLTETDRIRQREARAQGGQAAEAANGDIYADVVNGIKAIENRMELIRSDFLVTGQTVISEGGLELTVNAGRSASRSSTVGTAWSNTATATPMTDEEGVLDVMSDNEGLGPDDLIAIMSRATWREYKATDQVREAWPTVRVMDTIPVSAVNELRQDNDFPEVVVYNAQLATTDGTVRRVIPDGKVVYVPRNVPIGETQYGIPAIADESEFPLEADNRPGPVAYLTRQLKPLVVSTVVDALGVPVFLDPDATYALTV